MDLRSDYDSGRIETEKMRAEIDELKAEIDLIRESESAQIVTLKIRLDGAIASRDALKQRVDDLLVALQEARINFWAGNSADGSISEATFDDFVTGHNLKIDAVLRSGK